MHRTSASARLFSRLSATLRRGAEAGILWTVTVFGSASEGFHFEREALRFEVEAVHFEREALRFEVEAVPFEREAVHFEVEAVHFEVEAVRFEEETVPFEEETGLFDEQTCPFEGEAGRFEGDAAPFGREAALSGRDGGKLPRKHDPGHRGRRRRIDGSRTVDGAPCRTGGFRRPFH
jgi:hypothetical protein